MKNINIESKSGTEVVSNSKVDLHAILEAKRAETQTTRDIISDVQLKIADLNVAIINGRAEDLEYAELEALRASRSVYLELRDQLKEKLEIVTEELKRVGERAQSRLG